jgi:hypothetical protein
MRRHVIHGLQIVTALIGAFLLYRVFQQHDPRQIAAALRQIPATSILLAMLFSLGSYVCLTAIEYMGIVYATRRRLSVSRVSLVTVAALGIGHSVGLSALSSGAVRYRMYSRSGLNAEAMAKILLFSGLTVMVGLVAVFCLVAALHPDALANYLGMRVGWLGLLVVALVAFLALYVALCSSRAAWLRRGLRFGRIRLTLPIGALALGQIAVGAVNYLCIAAALYVCLEPSTATGYSLVVALIVLSDTAAILGHVPGGWGVLEYVVSVFLSGPGVIAGLIVFRAVYYLAPLVLGVLILLLDELSAYRQTAAAPPPDGRLMQRG